jgi:hypothetical protein
MALSFICRTVRRPAILLHGLFLAVSFQIVVAQTAVDTTGEIVLHSGFRFSGGFSFPILDYSTASNTGGGYAQIGGMVMAEYLREAKQNIDVGLLAGGFVNPFDNAAFKSLAGYGAGDDFNASPWKSYVFCATAGYGYYNWNGAFAHLHGGVMVLTAPEVTHTNNFAHSTNTVYPRTTGTGFTYGVSAGLSFGRVIFGAMFLTSDIDLPGWGTTENNGLNQAYHQPVYLAAIAAGITLP